MYFAVSQNTIMYLALALVGVLVWLFCMYQCANFARSNGRSYQLWMLIGLLTGPVGLAYAYIYFRFTGERHRRIRYGVGKKYDMPEIISCPSCGQSVPSAFSACQFCGAPLHGHPR
ncbi:MAG TPA: hypothetical protein VIK02_04100 [Candidatus Anoxymicrobiaceae bacterium]|jgi:hypothetical protein